MARGQSSLELLLLFLVFLAVLGISYSAAASIGAAAQKKAEAALSQRSFGDLSEKLRQACSLGDGNVRTAKISGKAASLSADGSELTFVAGSFSATTSSSCGMELLSGGPSSEFTIKNAAGKLEIS